MGKPARIPPAAKNEQYIASDPEMNSWVSAHAGSGKTHVLTQRVVRLLLAGNQPDRILCLTFTKAAAANMKNRILATLQSWAMIGDDALDRSISDLTGKSARPAERNRARRLFAAALDSPGGLKIQTIHAFCESLLHQFPLEANVPGNFETITENEQEALLDQARNEILAGKGTGRDLFDTHYAYLLQHVSEEAIGIAIREIIAMRGTFANWVDGNPEAAVAALAKKIGVSAGRSEKAIMKECINTIPASQTEMKSIMAACRIAGTNTAIRLAEAFSAILSADTDCFEKLKLGLLTKADEPLSSRNMPPAAVKKELPWAGEVITNCTILLKNAVDEIKLQKVLKLSGHIFEVGMQVLDRYGEKKRQLGVVDFDDQIERSANLLTRSEIREWIRFRLDRGIDHLLVDEAQDTSPAQWRIINAVTADFHTGESASRSKRTLFVVGDEKQSIFSFQGADPEEFQRQKQNLEKRLRSANYPYHAGRLQFSFRSTPDVLHAVDRVFETAENAAGLTQDDEIPVHDAVRSRDPGEVCIWPVVEAQPGKETDDWLAPVDRTGTGDPAKKLAERIATEIGGLVGMPLPGNADPVRFGDILVLVRKRDRFANALTRIMKDRGLAVSGVDRLSLAEHIAVEDLLATGRTILLPEDDLTLACVLKGPLFNFDEELLLEFCNGREPQGLRAKLDEIAGNSDHAKTGIAKQVTAKLDELAALAMRSNPYDFYAGLLARFGMRRSLLSRLGQEAEDVIDAFLEQAMNFRKTGGNGLEAFVHEIEQVNTEIKREVELERDEVKILTVHASKGLEAKVVFLVDPCDKAWTQRFAPKILPVGDKDAPDGFVWVPTAAHANRVSESSLDAIKSSAEAEYRRLLYVGMTRAADRLVVCGFASSGERNYDHWQKMVRQALAPTATETRDKEGQITAWRWAETASEHPPVTVADQLSGPEPDPEPLPEWISSKTMAAEKNTGPLSPSAVFSQEQGTLVVQWGEQNGTTSSQQDRGLAVHQILEFLPEVAPELRMDAVDAFLNTRYAGWSATQHQEVHRLIERLIASEAFGILTDRASGAEVTVSGFLDLGKDTQYVNGKIDRLVKMEDHLLVLDFKTDNAPPKEPAHIPSTYVVQLALYRKLVQKIHAGEVVHAGILWTENGELMKLDDQHLENALAVFK